MTSKSGTRCRFWSNSADGAAPLASARRAGPGSAAASSTAASATAVTRVAILRAAARACSVLGLVAFISLLLLKVLVCGARPFKAREADGVVAFSDSVA